MRIFTYFFFSFYLRRHILIIFQISSFLLFFCNFLIFLTSLSPIRFLQLPPPPQPPSSCTPPCMLNPRARICNRLRSSGIDSKQSIPQAYVAWRAGVTSNRVVVPPAAPCWESIPGLLKKFTNSDSVFRDEAKNNWSQWV